MKSALHPSGGREGGREVASGVGTKPVTCLCGKKTNAHTYTHAKTKTKRDNSTKIQPMKQLNFFHAVLFMGQDIAACPGTTTVLL